MAKADRNYAKRKGVHYAKISRKRSIFLCKFSSDFKGVHYTHEITGGTGIVILFDIVH